MEKPELLELWLDLGDESRQSAAQLGHHHTAEELPGTQVLCVTDTGSVQVAGFESETLTVGVSGTDGTPVLVTPETVLTRVPVVWRVVRGEPAGTAAEKTDGELSWCG